MNIVKMLCVVSLDGYYSAFGEMTETIEYIFNLDKLRHNPILDDKTIGKFEQDINFKFFMELNDRFETFDKTYPYMYGEIEDFQNHKELKKYLSYEVEEKSMDSVVEDIIQSHEYDGDSNSDYAILTVLYDVDTSVYYIEKI